MEKKPTYQSAVMSTLLSAMRKDSDTQLDYIRRLLLIHQYAHELMFEDFRVAKFREGLEKVEIFGRTLYVTPLEKHVCSCGRRATIYNEASDRSPLTCSMHAGIDCDLYYLPWSTEDDRELIRLRQIADVTKSAANRVNKDHTIREVLEKYREAIDGALERYRKRTREEKDEDGPAKKKKRSV